MIGPAPESPDLRDVTAKIRPDWDIAAPAMREAWEAGDRSRFYPYGAATALHEKEG